MDKWIDVNERLPEVNKAYLVNYVHSYCENDDFSAIGISLYFDGSFVGIISAYKVTHWMPLPEPPESTEETTLDNCSLIRNAGGKPKQYDGKCEGYSNKFDDEPCERCKECKLNVFYEE